MSAAFSAAVPPRMDSSGARATPNSSGVNVKRRTAPPWTSATSVSPASEISSRPPAPCTTKARSTPSSASVAATRSITSAEKTPSTCDCAPAGFVSGPRRLNTVRTPICLRAGAACRVAVCATCANRNPMPISRMARPYCSNGKSIRTPNASSTSADPLRELTARFPCFATRAPAAATTMAAAVEILNVFEPSPPVPHVSTILAGRASPSANTRAARRRITRPKPASSCTSRGRRLSASSNRTISGVSTWPESSSSITASASWCARMCPASTSSIRGSVIRRRPRSTAAPFCSPHIFSPLAASLGASVSLLDLNVPSKLYSFEHPQNSNIG